LLRLHAPQRQLNLYGFRRITKGVDTGAYVHPLFTRDGPPATVDAIKRVRKGGAPDGRWSAAKQRDALSHHHHLPPGTSPNSPHHFPDHHGSAEGRPRSWTAGGMGSGGGSGAYFGGRRLSGGGGTSDDDDDEHDDEDDNEDEDEYYPSGRRRKPAANIYSKPYFTAGSSSRRNPPRAAAHSNHHHQGLSGTGGNGSAITTSEAMAVPGAQHNNSNSNGAFQGRRQGMRARSGSVGSNPSATAASEWAYNGSNSSGQGIGGTGSGKGYFGNNVDHRTLGAAAA